MKNNNVKVLSLLVGCALSSHASAEILEIGSMNITSGTLVRSFNPLDSATPIVLDFTGNTDLVGGFINKDTTVDGQSISQTNFKQVKDFNEPTQYTYTAMTNIRHNPEWTGMAPPADGTITNSGAHYSAPTGTVDTDTGTISLDLSSWFANHMMMNQNLGGVATGQYDSVTGAITDLTWEATLSQGAQKGKTIKWTLQGTVLSTSPLVSHIQNSSFKVDILDIPVVDVYDATGNATMYSASLKLIPSTSGKLTFEVVDAEIKSTLQEDVLSTSPMMMDHNPSFKVNILDIPTVDVYDAAGNATMYSASLKLIPSTSGKLTFEVVEADLQ